MFIKVNGVLEFSTTPAALDLSFSNSHWLWASDPEAGREKEALCAPLNKCWPLIPVAGDAWSLMNAMSWHGKTTKGGEAAKADVMVQNPLWAWESHPTFSRAPEATEASSDTNETHMGSWTQPYAIGGRTTLCLESGKAEYKPWNHHWVYYKSWRSLNYSFSSRFLKWTWGL